MRLIYLVKKWAAAISWIGIATAFYFWVVSYSQSFKYCVQKSAAYQDHNAFNQVFAVFHCNGVFVNTHDKFISTISAVALVVVTSFLVWSGVAQAATTRKQLRAYIGVDEMPSPPSRHIEPDSAGILKGLALMKNFGATPALRMEHAFGMCVIAGDLPEEAFLGAKWSEKQISQPTQETTLAIHGSVPIDPSVWIAIKSGITNLNIYVFGIIRYEDIFGIPHFTRFCFKVEYRNGPTYPPGWDWYKHHNKTDDQKTYISEYAVRLLRTPFMWRGNVGSILSPTE